MKHPLTLAVWSVQKGMLYMIDLWVADPQAAVHQAAASNELPAGCLQVNLLREA